MKKAECIPSQNTNDPETSNNPGIRPDPPTESKIRIDSPAPLPQLIVVLGMHRSGTSAITRALQVLGVDLGDNLMPPAADNNEKGFWEDIDVVHFNTGLLKALDSDWHRLSPVTPDDLEILRQKGLYLKALDLLGQKTRHRPIFGIKDPRLAKLLPFWQEIFMHSGRRIGYVLTIRHPLSVVQSLALRDGFEPEKSYFLWLDHVLTSLALTTGSQRTLVDYDRLMQAPERELQRMADRFDLKPDPKERRLYLDAFLDKRLQHTVYTAGALSLDDSCPPLVREVYLALTEAAADHISLDDPALQRQFLLWQQELERLVSPLRFMDKQDAKLAIAAQSISDRDKAITGLRQTAAESRNQINRLNEILDHEKDRIAHLQQSITEAHAEVSRLEAKTFEKERSIDQLNRTLAERERQTSELKRELTERNLELAVVHRSKSWLLTAPLRSFRRTLISRPLFFLRRHGADVLRWFWQSPPVSDDCRQHLFFNKFLSFLGWSRVRRDGWGNPVPTAGQSVRTAALPDASEKHGVVISSQIASFNEYVPLFKGKPLEHRPVKLICFYLPQFHPIPENNAWWGENFTEWTNVQPAEPQFVGHYQPHVPDELGYYNLLDKSVQRRQIELAKLYGIEGFCFYFYWFNGKRLLETPIQNYLEDNGLDLPFCLCWANENWSRRWDGLDSEILIAQRHSAADDLAFIEHIGAYMRDPRYLRIDDKPLLLVYRPSLLPSPKETSARWRQWCRDHGIGEIYLAYTQSFEAADPGFYGFDAAIEFPPNNSSLPDITDRVQPLRDDFACNVYDWNVFVERSRHYQPPEYTLFRGVCPAWDNTARRKNRSSIMLHSSPQRYQQWLFNAMEDTRNRFINPEQRLLFINAWNEWAEGAHLEPDQRHGFAYLEATRMALVRHALMRTAEEPDRRRAVAIVIHAFYEEIFDEILGYLERIDSTPLKLYVSAPNNLVESLNRKLSQKQFDFYILPVINRGRDVLPFLKIMPEVIKGGHDFLIKIHTKKSIHRQDGDLWRTDIFEKLLDRQALTDHIELLNEHSEIGILGPAGHIVPMSFYWGSNAARVIHLAARMGLDQETLQGLNFVAGTMFIARIRAIMPLLNLALTDDDFEPEAAQVDGTLAHAIERLFAVSASALGMETVSKNSQVIKNYNFAMEQNE